MNRQEQLAKLVGFLDVTVREIFKSYIRFFFSQVGFSIGLVDKSAVDYMLSVGGLDESEDWRVEENIKKLEIGESNKEDAHAIAFYLYFEREANQSSETILLDPVGVDEEGLCLIVNLHYIKYMSGEPVTIETKIPIIDGNLSLIVGNCGGKFGDFVFIEFLLKLIAYWNFTSAVDLSFSLCVDYGKSIKERYVLSCSEEYSTIVNDLYIDHVKVLEVDDLVENLGDPKPHIPTVKIDLVSEQQNHYPIYLRFMSGYPEVDPTVACISLANRSGLSSWISVDDYKELCKEGGDIIKSYKENKDDLENLVR